MINNVTYILFGVFIVKASYFNLKYIVSFIHVTFSPISISNDVLIPYRKNDVGRLHSSIHFALFKHFGQCCIDLINHNEKALYVFFKYTLGEEETMTDFVTCGRERCHMQEYYSSLHALLLIFFHSGGTLK